MSASERSRFLVLDDYGTGGIWFVLLASSKEEIHEVLPTVTVYPPGSRPDWMSEEMLGDIEARRSFDIDGLPSSDWMNRLKEGRP